MRNLRKELVERPIKESPIEFEQELECVYKDEKYRVRDNGSVQRQKRYEGRLRQLDEKWTFGKVDKHKGYPLIAGIPIHRIVATAFHGQPPTKEHVVDHIDTNKQNNRPENLRWVTRLENLLLNPITRRRIEIVYGSIAEFLENPSEPKYGKLDQRFEWMRTVTREEAEKSHKRLLDWAKSGSNPSDGRLGEWLYTSNDEFIEDAEFEDLTKSLTEGAVQRDWRTPSEFPYSPSIIGSNSLTNYRDLLKEGNVFSINGYGESIVISAELSEDSKKLLVLCKSPSNVKGWSLAQITIEENQMVHENLGSFFTLEGANKQFALARGLEWEGGDSIDDYT